MATNTVKVELIGVDKNLSKSMHNAGKSATTFSNILKGLGKALLFIGTVAIAAVVGALIGMIAFVNKAKAAYEGWMQTLDDMQDVTGMSAKATSLLAFQARMADTDVGALTKGVGIFTKVLDAARRGTEASLDPFKRLGIHLRDADGKLRSLDDVLFEARDKLSQVTDQVKRNGIAAKLFGRGFAEMADWLDKSVKEMQKYTEWAKELGMVMGEKSMAAFQKYRENQRKLEVGWDAIKINAYGALVPLINDLMPKVIKVIWSAADWMKRFRNQVEKKGWEEAMGRMIPGFTEVVEVVKKIYHWVKNKVPEAIQSASAWWKRNKQTVGDVATAVWGILKWLARYGPVMGKVDAAFRRWMAPVNLVLSIIRFIRDAIAKVADAASRVGTALKNWSLAGLQAVLSLINSIASAAQRAYGYLSSLLQAQANNPNSGKGGGQIQRRARGGIDLVTSPTLFLAGEAGPEIASFTPLSSGSGSPAMAGAMAGGDININVVLPAGTALVGMARDVGEAIAPHVARALGREQARSGRRR